MRAARAELAGDGVWLLANALINLEMCARFVGKKDPPEQPVLVPPQKGK